MRLLLLLLLLLAVDSDSSGETLTMTKARWLRQTTKTDCPSTAEAADGQR